MNYPINWKLVSDAISYYQSIGFKYKEVPWIVSDLAIRITLPPNKNPLTTSDGVLIGSAEQSFIQMMLDGNLNPGKYVAASPCFRDDVVDSSHQRTFFKVELIEYLDNSKSSLEIDQAFFFILKRAIAFLQSIPGAENSRAVVTEAGFDIELNGLELGSYGFNQYNNHKWIYGTGIAEPRLSMAIGKKI